MKILYLITARGGSKGIPGKNIKPLAGKPLIHYSLDVALSLSAHDAICVSTDDENIISSVESYGLKVPFRRPDHLASDTSGSYEVILHALEHYEKSGKQFDAIVLLQPTSPFRKAEHVKEAIALFDPSVDMVASVKEPDSNPYYNIFEEDAQRFLKLSKDVKITRRQDAPKVYQFNGAVYVINTSSLKKYKSFGEFDKVRKYTMSAEASLDLDTPLDWAIAETLLEKGFIK